MVATGFSTSVEQSQLNWLRGTAFQAAPGTVYLGLLTGLPTAKDGSGFSEATGTRSSVTLSAPAADPSGHQYVTNSGSVTQTLNSPCFVIGFGLFTASTGGNPVFWDKLPHMQVPQANQSVVIPDSSIRVYLTRNQ